jgi:hypothetical protein
VAHHCNNIASYEYSYNKSMVSASVCDFSLFLHNCTVLQTMTHVNGAILLFLSPSSAGVGEGKQG